MKSVISKKEGVKMNSQLDFGSTFGIEDQFKYIASIIVTMWDINIHNYYRLTDDGFIQIATKFEDDNTLKIEAQYKIRYKSIHENIKFILCKIIEAKLLYEGYPKYSTGELVSESEFNSMITFIKGKSNSIKSKSLENKTPLIEYFEKKNLNPTPAGITEHTWIAICPFSKGRHFIEISTKTDEWGCGYCQKKGGVKEMKSWLKEK